MAKKKILPGKKIEGIAEFPGDKSISHRYAMIAALAEGVSEIQNYASAADCHSTLRCIGQLGVKVDREKDVIRIHGVGLEGLKAPKKALDAENSGTTMRLLAGVLAGQPFESELTGDKSLRRRPMRRIIDPLCQMGARLRPSEGDRAPIKVRGGNLNLVSPWEGTRESAWSACASRAKSASTHVTLTARNPR